MKPRKERVSKLLVGRGGNVGKKHSPCMPDDEKLHIIANVCQPSTLRASSEWRQDNWLEIEGFGGGCSQRSRLNALT